MGEENFSEKIPTVYDLLYYDSWIINRLCELDSIKKFLEKFKIDLKDIYHGYLYLLELAIMNVVNHIEDLVNDENIFELIHWGNVSTRDKKLMGLLEGHPEIKSILSLLAIRKQLSSIRFKEMYDEKKIIIQLNNLKDVLDKLKEFLTTEYAISKVDVNEERERMLILNWILNNYNYIEVSFEVSTEGEESLSPLWPGLPYFYSISDNLQKNYCLQHPKIKSRERNYLRGFLLSLLYLYKNLVPRQINKFEKDMLNVENWTELHELGIRIYNEIIKSHETFLKLFNIAQNPKRTTLKKDKIENYEELKLVLRGRKVRVITSRFSGDYLNTQTLFLHVLFGAIEMYRFDLRNKPEIIEFKQIYGDVNRVEYSYAIYIPIPGVLWNASYWLVFDRLCTESNCEAYDIFSRYLKMFKEKGVLYFHRYKIRGDLFRKYIENNDFETKTRKSHEEKLKVCKGLLGEFLAGFYLLKKENISEIVGLDFHRKLKGTDVDVIGETKSHIIIVQVKPNLTLSHTKRRNILDHFDKVLKDVDTNGKKVKKILFILNSNIPETEIDELWKDEKISEKGVITYQDVEKEKHKIIELFQKEGVEIKFLKDLKEQLEVEKKYRDLLSKLGVIFPEMEE